MLLGAGAIWDSMILELQKFVPEGWKGKAPSRPVQGGSASIGNCWTPLFFGTCCYLLLLDFVGSFLWCLGGCLLLLGFVGCPEF